MLPGRELGSLKTKEWEKIHQLVNQFEERCREGRADLAPFVPAPGDPLRVLVLQELIKSDLDQRWQQGHGRAVEEYLQDYPELKNHREAVIGLLLEEYQARLRHGEKPALDSYRERFPEHFEDIQTLLADTSSATERVPAKPDAVPPLASQPSVSRGEVLAVGGGYRLLEVLGEGQFGKVWRAEAPGGKPVAVKVISWPLDHPASQRELQSLEVIKHINHPYLLDIHAFYPLQDRLIVAMGLADGSLRGRLAEFRRRGEKGVPPQELLRFMEETAEVLDFLHERQIQHRDIKPENILLSSGHVRVGDLGLARLVQEQVQQANVSILGTPPYMAPETWFGKVHNHSDQYSLAVTYAELRRGKCPFKTGNIEGLLAQHLEDAAGLVSLSEAEREVLVRAGSREPEDRYPSCTAFVTALREVVLPKPKPPAETTIPSSTRTLLPGGEESQTPTDKTPLMPSWRPPLPEPVPRRNSSWMVLMILLVALLPLVWFVPGWLPPQPAPPGPAPGDFRLVVLSSPTAVAAGETEMITIHLIRENWEEPIELKFTPVAGVVLKKSAAKGEQEQIQVEVKAEDAAAPGKRKIVVQAHSGEAVREAALFLNVTPLKTLPPPCAAGIFLPTAETKVRIVPLAGRKYYEEIDLLLNENGNLVRFLLVDGSHNSDKLKGKLPPFYIMQDMVCNELFAHFAGNQSDAVQNEQWKLGARVVSVDGKEIDLGSDKGDWPVLRVDLFDAHRFARGMGGKLPSITEWDQAAGVFTDAAITKKRPGPYALSWDWLTTDKADVQSLTLAAGVGHANALSTLGPLYCLQANSLGIAIDREAAGPLPVGAAFLDVSDYGCRDMSGNGFEWTRTYWAGGELEDVDEPQMPEKIWLRSQSFDKVSPYQFESFNNKGNWRKLGPDADPDDIFWGRPIYQIGFRVVITPPKN